MEVSPAKLIAFGVTIESKAGNARELVELVKYAEMAHWRELAEYIASITYADRVARFTLRGDPCEERLDELHQLATDFLRDFALDGRRKVRPILLEESRSDIRWAASYLPSSLKRRDIPKTEK